MDWTILDSDVTSSDSTGVEGFIKRMDTEFRGDGVPWEGFRIIKSGMEMYNITRQIEADKCSAGASDASLYVGFQNVAKFINENNRYAKITNLGINVFGFGEGSVAGETGAVKQWVALPIDHKSFENQWYLISMEPEPFIFIGWETSENAQFGVGGVSSPGKEFKGFISDDTRIVKAAISHLESVRSKSAFQEALSMDDVADKLGFAIDRIMVLTEDGKKDSFGLVRESGISLATKTSADVIAYDTSAISYLVNPYPSELYEKEYSKSLDSSQLLVMGRQYLSEQINLFRNEGVSAKAVLPTDHGFEHLAEWADREEADVIMLPDSMIKEGIVGRLQGYTLSNLLSSTHKPVLIVDKLGKAKVCTNELTVQKVGS